MKNASINIDRFDSIYRNGAVIYWKIHNQFEDFIQQKILPAFYFDLIIPLSGRIHVDDHWLSSPFMSPILKGSKKVTFEPRAELEGFRFNPLYFSLLTTVQPRNLIQSFNLLEALECQDDRYDLIRGLRSLKDLYGSSLSNASITRLFDERLKSYHSSLEKLRQAVYLLLSENLSVKDIANRLEVSTRWIQKLFKRYFNTTPRELVQISRFNDSLNLIMTEKNMSMTSVTYSAHFYDQSHFIRSFRQFTGLLPSQFAKENHQFYKVMNS